MAFLSTGNSHHDLALVETGSASPPPGPGLHHFALKVGDSTQQLADVKSTLAVEGVAVPVRVVHGSADSAVPLRQSRDLMRFLRDGSLYVIEGADHWYAEGDEWQRMATDLVEFFSKTL